VIYDSNASKKYTLGRYTGSKHQVECAAAACMMNRYSPAECKAIVEIAKESVQTTTQQ
jgi:hypothetical protein